jgi:hypothetical protein
MVPPAMLGQKKGANMICAARVIKAERDGDDIILDIKLEDGMMQGHIQLRKTWGECQEEKFHVGNPLKVEIEYEEPE